MTNNQEEDVLKGLVHIYTGDGKGKTTAAVGLGIRACGRGMKVLMVQFLKGTDTGEVYTLKKLEPDFTLHRRTEIKKFTCSMSEKEMNEAEIVQKELFDFAVNSMKSGEWDLIILDEIMAAISSGFIGVDNVVDFIIGRPDKVEIVLTGRNAPAELIALADYISDIRAVKHPMKKGIPARKGIEN